MHLHLDHLIRHCQGSLILLLFRIQIAHQYCGGAGNKEEHKSQIFPINHSSKFLINKRREKKSNNRSILISCSARDKLCGEILWQVGSNNRHKHFNLIFSAVDNHTLCKDDSSITAALHLDPLASSFSTAQHPQLN